MGAVHLNKTEICESVGIKLIQIFEDDYHNKKDIILKYISNILGCNNIIDLYIECREINVDDFKEFFNKNSVCDFIESETYIGAYNNDILYAVMSFNENELVQYAYDLSDKVNNIEKELLNYYIKNYNPIELFYNADRMWYIDDFLLDELNFELIDIIEPSYKLYNISINKLKRYKVGEIDEDSSDRIWDCGFKKYKLKI